MNGLSTSWPSPQVKLLDFENIFYFLKFLSYSLITAFYEQIFVLFYGYIDFLNFSEDTN